jgi:hypothetical protein
LRQRLDGRGKREEGGGKRKSEQGRGAEGFKKNTK